MSSIRVPVDHGGPRLADLGRQLVDVFELNVGGQPRYSRRQADFGLSHTANVSAKSSVGWAWAYQAPDAARSGGSPAAAGRCRGTGARRVRTPPASRAVAAPDKRSRWRARPRDAESASASCDCPLHLAHQPPFDADQPRVGKIERNRDAGDAVGREPFLR